MASNVMCKYTKIFSLSGENNTPTVLKRSFKTRSSHNLYVRSPWEILKSAAFCYSTHTYIQSPHSWNAAHISPSAETPFTAVSVEQNQRWRRPVDMADMTSRPSCVFFFFSSLTAPGSYHLNAILPAFITCRTTRHVTARASWRVTGPINPVWQLPDAPSGSSPPSLSCSHIPFSQGPITDMIYSSENGEQSGNAPEIGFTFSFLNCQKSPKPTGFLCNLFFVFVFSW